MSDIEEKLLREILLEIYRTEVPEFSSFGALLIRRLAHGLYERGGRISLGATTPPKLHHLHISVDAQDRIAWTDRELHGRLGYKAHSLIGKPIDQILSAGSAAFRREFGLPTLLREGKIGPVPVTFVAANGDLVIGSATSQVLRDSSGAFLRTFTRIAVPLALVGGLIYMAAC